MNIDIDKVLRTRLGKNARFVPRFATRLLEKIICQDQLNELLTLHRGKTGAEFCRGVVDTLDITVDTYGTENIPGMESRPMFVSNHPLGGLDGMILIDTITRIYGKPVKFVVNDLLMAVEPLRDVFLPVNHHGAQSKESAAEIESAFESDNPIIIFPAGLVSRKQPDGSIADLKWHKMFLKKALHYNRTIIPVHFIGLNSPFFYNFAYLRRKSGIKFNIDMIFLPREVFRSKGKEFNIVFGKPLTEDFLRGDSPAKVAGKVREIVHSLTAAEKV